MQTTDVVIVGCGPVGALLANLLGARGIRTLVLEREQQIHQLPRALAFDDEVKRVFQSAGLDMSFGRSAISLKGMDLIAPGGKRLRRFDIQNEPQRLGHPLVTTFHQPELEAVIRDGLARFPESVDMRVGARVRRIKDEGDSALVEYQLADGGATERVQSKFVVGCDGSRSFVRNACAIELEDLGLHQPWLVVDVIMKRQIDMDRWAQQICDFRRPATFVPSPPPRNRFEFMLVDGDDPLRMTNPDCIDDLIRPWLAPDDYKIERAAVYTFHALIAKEFRRNRVLIAGDAAHQMPPFLGQGMCAGIRDAFNLAWKLDLILSEQAGLELLDSYGSERSKHVRQVIKTAVQIGKIIQAPSRTVAILRNALMRASEVLGLRMQHMSMCMEPIGPGFYSQTAIVPEAFRIPCPQPLVRDCHHGQLERLDQFLGPHFTLLTRTDDFGTDFDPLIKRLTVVSSEREALVDSEGAVNAWLDELNADAVLLRPDRVPFGIYRGATARLEAVSEDLGQRLSATGTTMTTTMSL